jgi:hypothetical protein
MAAKRQRASLALAPSHIVNHVPVSPHSIHDARRFAFSVLVNGSRYAQAAHIFLWNEIIPPCLTLFFEAQKELTVISLSPIDILRMGQQCYSCA